MNASGRGSLSPHSTPKLSRPDLSPFTENAKTEVSSTFVRIGSMLTGMLLAHAS